MFATGIVVSVNEKTVTARVRFPDRENMISWDLNVNQTRSGMVWMPRLGEQVNCLMDDALKSGSIIGSFYTKENPPPVKSTDKCHITFNDGTIIEYDPASHHLKTDIGTGTAEIKASTITLDGDVDITGSLSVSKDATADGTITGKTAVKDTKGSIQDIRTHFNEHTHVCTAPGIDSATPKVPMP